MVIELVLQVTGRRQFLGGLLAASLVPKPSWSDAGSPVFLSAALKPNGSYVLCGIGNGLDIRFEVPLPARGHAAAAHPTRPTAVAFARRPGTFALVLDCVSGTRLATLNCPEGRHFYGHGAFSSDGNLLYTTENAFDAGRGVIGVWNARDGYARVAEWPSGGIGPHDVKRIPGSEVLVVANGGIDTHPDTGRTKLNIPTMNPNLSYIEDGNLIDVAEPPKELRKNSIRHISVDPLGNVAFGMQWQGDGMAPALVGQHHRGKPLHYMEAPEDAIRAMNGYVGSIAHSKDRQTIAVTSPRGGQVQTYDTVSNKLLHSTKIADVCGVAPSAEGFSVTSGTGELINITARQKFGRVTTGLAWDNHLVST